MTEIDMNIMIKKETKSDSETGIQERTRRKDTAVRIRIIRKEGKEIMLDKKTRETILVIARIHLWPRLQMIPTLENLLVEDMIQ